MTAPTLLLVGRHDPVCAPPATTRIARRIPGAEVVVFEESGHFPWLDEPTRFYPAMYDWLDRHLTHNTWRTTRADHDGDGSHGAGSAGGDA